MSFREEKCVRKTNIEYESIKKKIKIFIEESQDALEKSKINGINWISLEKIRYSYNESINSINNLLESYKFNIIIELMKLYDKINSLKKLITDLYNIFKDDIAKYDSFLEKNFHNDEYKIFFGIQYEENTYIKDLYRDIEYLF